MSMLNTNFTAQTQTTNTKEHSNMSTTQTIKNKQALIQQATTELQTITENITAINKSNLNKTIKTQLLAENNKRAKDLQDKAIKLSLEIDTLTKEQELKNSIQEREKNLSTVNTDIANKREE